MEASYIQLVKIDHDNNNVVVEPIDEQENIKHYVMDMLATISENVGEREYIFNHYTFGRSKKNAVWQNRR